MSKYGEPLSVGVYETTQQFREIEQHSCICRTDDLGLVAVVGPAGDAESEQLGDRIVLCVNTCAGYTPEQIAEAFALYDKREAIREKLETIPELLTDINDELKKFNISPMEFQGPSVGLGIVLVKIHAALSLLAEKEGDA